ncbi:hypothetical protein [Bradyrhizobium sp.]|uniref:hypothetical protein n=1 Tax=Bradyrhizobium sp. TaxID=376 RepID=UPI002397C898|nr:hypothetical protein [Bradyrhizobium sp.]MDE2379878.1 hypothetical protein [Bradyrhizobium sp.]
MRFLILMTTASLFLTGCTTTSAPESPGSGFAQESVMGISPRAMPGLKARYETAEAAKQYITPELIKDCANKLTREYPQVTIIGNFSMSPLAASKVGDLQMFPGGPNDEIVALVAPTSNKNIFGGDNRTISGCSYRLHENTFTFRKVHGPGSFGRVNLVSQPASPATPR